MVLLSTTNTYGSTGIRFSLAISGKGTVKPSVDALFGAHDNSVHPLLTTVLLRPINIAPLVPLERKFEVY